MINLADILDPRNTFMEEDGSQNLLSAGIAAADPPTSLLNHPPADRLLPHHREQLRASGLNDETILAAGLYSESDSTQLAALLNWNSDLKKIAPALVFPFWRLDGTRTLSRVKPDCPRISGGKPVKYESPKGCPNEPYFPPHVAERLLDPALQVFITEGEKKALALDQYGYAAIGLVGVFGWKVTREERLLPDLAGLQWVGRQVIIVFDSDIQRNPNVLDAETRLAAQLQCQGALVRVVRLPDGVPDEEGHPTKRGVDDFLVQEGLTAFQTLVDHAQPPAGPSISTRLPAKNLDPDTEIQAFLQEKEQDGVSRIRHWRGGWYYYQDGCYAEVSSDELQGTLVRHINTIASRLTAFVLGNFLMQLRAQTNLPVSIRPPAWLDDPPVPWPEDEILACPSHLIHLPSLIENKAYAIPATPRFFTTVALDYDFDITAPWPTTWLDFLASVWPDDSEAIETLQEWFGYCLTLDTRQQKILMLIGPRRSGKGTIARVLRELVGRDNTAGPTLSSLGQNFGLWPLIDKGLAIISDARLGGSSGASIVTERLLSISGEDALTIDRKNQIPITCKLDTRLMLLSNELPHFTDASGALPGRMLVLQQSKSWYRKEDLGLFDKLRAELPAILLWAIQGWQRLRERGHFVTPSSSQGIVEEFNDLASPIGAFVRECCDLDPQFEVGKAELYAAYQQWCYAGNGRWPKPQSLFGRDLHAAVVGIGDRQKHGGIRFYGGLRLKPPTLGPANPLGGRNR